MRCLNQFDEIWRDRHCENKFEGKHKGKALVKIAGAGAAGELLVGLVTDRITRSRLTST
jgi:hypothetical protein